MIIAPLFVLGVTLAQQSAFDARQVMDKAVQAHGGAAALQSIKDITREMSVIATDPAQGRRPDTPATTRAQQVSVADLQKQRFRDDIDAVREDGRSTKQVTVVSGGAAFAMIGKNVVDLPAAVLPLLRAQSQRRHPEMLLLAAWSRPEALRFLGDETFEGRPQKVLAYADTDGTAAALSFDAQTGLLTKVEVVADSAVMGDIATATVFAEYTDENGVKLPHRYTDYSGGRVTREAKVTAVRINTNPADALFTKTEKGTPFNPGGPPVTTKLGDNIYHVRGNYSSMFAVFPDYVAVVEPGSGVADAVFAEIRKVAPGKPIKYVVVTHFHHDHIGSIRRYVSEGATIICLPDARKAIEQAVASTHRLRPDPLSKSPKSPVFEIVQGKRVFEGGGVTMEVRDISPSPHVAEMLLVYFPGVRVLFEGDLLDNMEINKPVNDPATQDLAKKIDGWAIDTIIPVHGLPATMEDLKAALARER